METISFPLLSPEDQEILREALHYMKVAELRAACHHLSLPDAGKKGFLIQKIMQFIIDGTVLKVPSIPVASRAKSYAPQPLLPSSLMLYGAYKNDAKARAFFKSLIGPHFHFTAFGIDWLNERWLHGKPPTYQEFADFWIQETMRRTKEKQKPKDEWMFIRYMQKMEREAPRATSDELIRGWKELQVQEAQTAAKLLIQAIKQLRDVHE